MVVQHLLRETKRKLGERVGNPGRKVGREERIRRLNIIMWEKSRKRQGGK